MGKILIGVDGSPASRRAAHYAAQLASALGDRAIVAFVNPPLAAVGPDTVIPQTWADQLRRQGKEVLRQAADSSAWSVPPDQQLLEGPVAETLARFANEAGVEIIVVGRRGHGQLAGLLGSAADRLMQIAGKPVLLVPCEESGAPGETSTRIRTVVVGIDGSPEARKALALAKSIAGRVHASLILVHAVAPPAIPAGYLPGLGWWERAAMAWGEQLARQEAAHLEAPCETVVRMQRPSVLLASVAEERDADLIVVGHRGLTAVNRLWLGNVAAEVLRGARRPVLVSR